LLGIFWAASLQPLLGISQVVIDFLEFQGLAG